MTLSHLYILFAFITYAACQPECATNIEEHVHRFLDFTTLNVKLSVPGRITVIQDINVTIPFLHVQVYGTPASISRVLVSRRENITYVGDEVSIEFRPSLETVWSTITSMLSSTMESLTSHPSQTSVSQQTSNEPESTFETRDSVTSNPETSNPTSDDSTTGTYESSSLRVGHVSLLASGAIYAITRNPALATIPLLASAVCQNSTECVYVVATLHLPRLVASYVPIEVNATLEYFDNPITYRFGYSKTENYAMCYNAGIHHPTF
jgi:hypothetical protein